MLDKNAIISHTVHGRENRSSGVYRRLGTDQRACEIRKRYATGNSEPQLLTQSLANDGVSLEDVASVLQVVNLEAALKREENHWIADLEAIVRMYRSVPVSDRLSPSSQSVGAICLAPFVAYLLQRLTPDMERFSKIITPTAQTELVSLVAGKLAFCAENTLLTCARYFENAKDVPYWRTVPVSEGGKRFLAWFYEQGIELLVNTYPVLARKLLLLLETHRKNCMAFLENFQKDIPQIATVFGIPEKEIVICTLKGNLSDAHNKGRSVLKLGLRSGQNLFYKPRSMAVDFVWRKLVDRLGENGFPTRLAAPPVLDRGTYGYTREITSERPLREEDIREYYRNAGGLCCVVCLLGGSDFHHENIIAQGTVPVLIDVETIMTPKPAPVYGLAEINKSEGASTHVGRTLMLQQWVGDSVSSARDIGGFTSEQDDMQNIPAAQDGGRKGAEYYPREFAEGFAAAYDFLAEHRQKILGEKWLDGFAGCRFRYVFRRTALYYSLMQHFYSAPFLRDINYFEAALSRLGAGILLNFEKGDAERLWKVVTAEKQAMGFGDIPYFTCYGGSRDLSSAQGLCVRNFFETSPVELAQKNLLGMSEEAKEKELAYIRLDLETCRLQKEYGIGTPLLSYQNVVRHPYPAGENLLWPEVERIMQTIRTFELEEGSFEYYAPVRNPKTTRYNLEVLPSTLYSGTLGILLVQAAYAKQTGNDRLRTAVLGKMQALYREEFYTGRRAASLNIGFSQGISGYLQTAMVLADLLGDKWLEEMALSVAVDVPEEHIARTAEVDFFGGLAGTLYYFSKLYQRRPHPALYARIQCLLQALLSRASAYRQWKQVWRSEREYQPLTGLAHGQCGIAAALLEAQKILGDPGLARTARQLVLYEDSCYSQSENNWLDFRRFEVHLRGYTPGKSYHPRFMYGYCSGAPGIGVARILAARQLNSREFDEDIGRALKFCLSPRIIGNDSLCCGSGAWVEFLLEASLYTGKAEYRSHARKLCAGILPEVSGRAYLLSNLNGAWDISLFKGCGGVAYQLMRTLDPVGIPSVLL